MPGYAEDILYRDTVTTLAVQTAICSLRLFICTCLACLASFWHGRIFLVFPSYCKVRNKVRDRVRSLQQLSSQPVGPVVTRRTHPFSDSRDITQPFTAILCMPDLPERWYLLMRELLGMTREA